MTNMARQITAENIEEIAEWCGRETGTFDDEREFVHHTYIKVNADDIAVVGDWIVMSDDKKVKAITDEEYLATLASEEKNAERFQKVFDLVKQAMVLQDAATYNGHESSTQTDGVAFGIAQKILEII